MPIPRSNKLVNRTAVGTYQGKPHQRQSGLLKKEESGANGEAPTAAPEPAPINNIQCDGEVVEIDTLTPDPLNARLHPDRNLEAIKESLRLYGQRKPLVVRSEGMVVAAGNGTLLAMRELGWTRAAVSIRPMTDQEFTGYALADNRTAELAKWDFQVVAQLDRLMQEIGQSNMVGWSLDELEVLRAADWSPPEVQEDEGAFSDPKRNHLAFSDEQAEVVEAAIAVLLRREGDLDLEAAARLGLTRTECVKTICQEWLNASAQKEPKGDRAHRSARPRR